MSRLYTPRRAGLDRWLKEAPAYILDCFDSKGSGERYTVLFTKELSSVTGSFAETWVSYLGMSDSPTGAQGIGIWGEFKAHECVSFRTRVKHQRVRWLDLPQHIRDHVIARATSN